MTPKELAKEISNVREFILQRKRIERGIQTLFDDQFVNVTLGDKFLDDYVKLISKCVGDDYEWVNWFIWENDFGKDARCVYINGVEYPIKTVDQLYKICIKGIIPDKK
jgi:hypothetical protein